MANTAIRERRVSEWKASGRTSVAHREGKPFTAGGLRHGLAAVPDVLASPLANARDEADGG